MLVSFEISTLISASPTEIYNAWLSSEGHTTMTGSPAMASSRVGETFEAWDGYITGENLALEPGRRIVQSWRTTEFNSVEQDSLLEILLVPAFEQTKLVLRHSKLPEHGTQYEQGWEDAYFTPMGSYFRPETKE